MKVAFIDLFCGAGGVTTGVQMSKHMDVVACVNHDPVMIRNHKANHPEVLHFTEDVRDMRVINHLGDLTKSLRKEHPEIIIYLWASLECTNFSKAKGGMPRDADSRTLADCLDQYVEALNPDGIWIENVVEFMSWGPLDDNGKPISNNAGSDYIKWVNRISSYGYRFDFKILNAADFGAYTSRKRYFAQFMKHGLPLTWPKPTHSKNPTQDMFGGLEPHKAVKECLDLEDHGNSIFKRKKALSDRTLERIYYGLIKYVAGGKNEFSEHQSKVDWILKYNSRSKNGKHIPPSIEAPCPTIAAQPRLGKITAMIMTYNGTGHNCHNADGPSPTIRTGDGLALVTPQWMDMQYSGPHNNHALDRPTGTLLTTPKQNLVTLERFTFDNQFSNNARSIDSIGQTLIARMDKKPTYLVTVEGGQLAVPIHSSDSDSLIKIKVFMALYGIVDIKLRMLKVEELLKIQGFPSDYILLGTQADQKKAIGNSVVPQIVQAMMDNNYELLSKHLAQYLAA